MISLPQLPQDKANHFVYGAVIFTVLQFFFLSWVSLLIVVIIGGLKELRDAKGHGTPEWNDFLITAAGGLSGFLCTIY